MEYFEKVFTIRWLGCVCNVFTAIYLVQDFVNFNINVKVKIYLSLMKISHKKESAHEDCF